jgi:hypothetical protein
VFEFIIEKKDYYFLKWETQFKELYFVSSLTIVFKELYCVSSLYCALEGLHAFQTSSSSLDKVLFV